MANPNRLRRTGFSVQIVNDQWIYLFADTGMRACETSWGKGGLHFFEQATFSEHFNTTACVRPVKYKDNKSKPLLATENALAEVPQMVESRPKLTDEILKSPLLVV